MEYLKIKNFLIIEEADFEVGRFNIIIGSQASGKSIIAKLLYFFRKPLSLESSYNPSKKFELIFPKNTWKEQSFEIYYQIDNIKIELNNKDGEVNFDIDSSILLAEENIKTTFFIPANRSAFSLIQDNIFTLLRNDVTIDFFIQEFGSYYEKAKKIYSLDNTNIEIQTIVVDILKGKYEYQSGQDWIRTNQRRIPLSYASSGQQEALPMLILLSVIEVTESYKNSNIFIEEPEAHLFPVSQKRIIELLSFLYNKNNANFFLTTHSPYILTAINNAILAHDIITEKGKEAVKDIFNPDFSIQYEDVRAYTIENGKLMSILDDETRLIGASVIDSVSDEFENVFNSLLEL